MRLTVCGSLGFGNAGDEAIPLAISDMLGAIGADIGIDVLSRYDAPELPGIIGMGARDARRRDALRQQPLLMCGGGIVENQAHATIRRCAPFYRGDLRAPMSFFGISADHGVHYRWRDRLQYAYWMHAAGTVFARDEWSARTLRDNFPGIDVKTIGDLVLWMRPAAPRAERLRLPPRYVAVVLAPRWDGSDWLDWISGELAQIAHDLSAAVVFVPMSCQHDDDRAAHAPVAQRLRQLLDPTQVLEWPGPLGPREVAAVLAGSGATVAMRLHGCVMAYAQRVPFIALAYHPKLAGFAETIGMPWSVLPAQVPDRQSPGAYGYRFADLGLAPGELRAAVARSVRDARFDQLDLLKARSLDVLSDLIGRWSGA